MPLSIDQTRLRPFLDDLWRWKCGLPPKDGSLFEQFVAEQWSEDFERLMQNRLVLGGLRYRIRALAAPASDGATERKG